MNNGTNECALLCCVRYLICFWMPFMSAQTSMRIFPVCVRKSEKEKEWNQDQFIKMLSLSLSSSLSRLMLLALQIFRQEFLFVFYFILMPRSCQCCCSLFHFSTSFSFTFLSCIFFSGAFASGMHVMCIVGPAYLVVLCPKRKCLHIEYIYIYAIAVVYIWIVCDSFMRSTLKMSNRMVSNTQTDCMRFVVVPLNFIWCSVRRAYSSAHMEMFSFSFPRLLSTFVAATLRLCLAVEIAWICNAQSVSSNLILRKGITRRKKKLSFC